MALAAELLELPRGLGDPRRDASIRALTQRLQVAGLAADAYPFEARDPKSGATYALANVVGSFRPHAPRRFVLATHFDTRPWADEDPDPRAHTLQVPGANDGTSGLVVTLALAQALQTTLPSNVGFTVVLFDGEELGHPGFGGYCAGSRRLAEAGASDPDAAAVAEIRSAEFGLVLDMVGDADLEILVEPNSQAFNPWLVEHIFGVARRDGVTAFNANAKSPGIIDDHTFLTALGVPSVLLIDYTYPHWHTRSDTLGAISEESLAGVFEVALRSLTEALVGPARQHP